MNIPRRYIVKSVLRLLLLAFVIALFSYRLFAVVLVPCYVIFFFKTYIFASWCCVVNISQRKIWLFFSVMLILFEITAVFLRRMFGQMLLSIGTVGFYEIQRWLGL